VFMFFPKEVIELNSIYEFRPPTPITQHGIH
jgi:hypothetical protein